jgi:hypothetical protein
MAKIRRFFRCPVCKELLALEIDNNIKTDRWPFKLEGKHGNHGYVVLLDSQLAVTDVKKRPEKTS